MAVGPSPESPPDDPTACSGPTTEPSPSAHLFKTVCFPCAVRAGPGCSSLGGGLFSELGPWYPNAHGTLDPNPYAWNTVANVIFLGA